MSIKKIAELANTSPVFLVFLMTQSTSVMTRNLQNEYGKLQADLIICLTQLLVNFAKENLN